MKKGILFIALVIGCLPVANGQLLLTEDFNYTAGGPGDTLGLYWAWHSGTVPIYIVTPGLQYTGYVGAGNTPAAAVANGGSCDYNKTFTAQTSGNVYASFLVNVSAVNTTGDYFIHYLENPINTSNIRGRFYAKTDASSNLIFRLSYGSAGAVATGAVYALNTTYLVVLKMQIGAGTNDDSVSVFIFSDPTIPATEPTTATLGPIGDVATADISNIGAIALRQGAGNTPTVKVDGIRVATTWAEAPLPVQMTSLTASSRDLTAELQWATASEVHNQGFDIERRLIDPSAQMSSWMKVGFVAGSGTSSSPHSYSFVDKGLSAGRYGYRIKQIDADGSIAYSLSVEVEVGTYAKTLTLRPNYPNPFNPSTNIEFAVPTDGIVTLRVFNMIGQEVATLYNGDAKAGYLLKATFDGSNLPSGMYFSRLEHKGQTLVHRITLMK
ncbi:MAG: T9SS type A sorting domain-containing protein [Bacteroidota bacterium]